MEGTACGARNAPSDDLVIGEERATDMYCNIVSRFTAVVLPHAHVCVAMCTHFSISAFQAPSQQDSVPMLYLWYLMYSVSQTPLPSKPWIS